MAQLWGSLLGPASTPLGVERRFLPEELTSKLNSMREFRVRIMVAGFSGWPDAGNVSTLSVGYLKDKLGAEKLWELGGQRFYDLTSARPYVRIRDGLLLDLKPPSTELYGWRSPMGDKAVLILLGGEPSFDWESYCELVLEACEEAGIGRIYLVGGVLDSVPHTRRPRITAIVNMERLREELRVFDLTPSNYNGPSSIHSYLMLKAKERGVEAIGLWGHAPSYISMPNARVALHVLRKLTNMLGVSLDLGEMEERADELDAEVNRMMSENLELQRLVKALERSYDEGRAPSYIT